METSESSCCTSKEEKDAADAARFGLPDPRELQDDPVLAGCCEEDLRNMRRAEALRQALLDVDRSTARLKLQQQALHVPAQQHQPPHQQPDTENLLNAEQEEEEDDDGLLSELRRRRLAELQRQAVERRQAADQGYGRLNDLPPGALMAGAMLDEHLTTLAHRYRWTFFARAAVKRGEPLVARLRLEELPALLCFRSTALVGRAAVSQFGPPGCLVEEEVTSYLRRLRVLRDSAGGGARFSGRGPRRRTGGAAATAPGTTTRPGGGSRTYDDDDGDEDDIGDGGGGGSDVEGEDQEDEEEWRLKPCDVCGRRYPHEHVRAVYSTCHRRDHSDGGSSGDDDDDGGAVAGRR
ncbi:hypothetical protein VOLCADRAFT_116398 [Volvox carteri f. nagariensis]|uniref:Uncharacterized protein n=1 Tax=Volvox carteri f. nagariensis TaxID=3068 RepID=D8TLV2_VOLCA|nr:uncharacterized protein VOLCADRAFT_116398 [Volvox carteri f. nagariensis]EFJ51528.1 hypothetical protein VOLCADRAFT_116398 [Volvox carteri f. nagariensis]|eukprot:XP_002947480.1 hypothetical protein VOLCADRAFT_116398 [Volvox carteri f. nagariensis]